MKSEHAKKTRSPVLPEEDYKKSAFPYSTGHVPYMYIMVMVWLLSVLTAIKWLSVRSLLNFRRLYNID
jgi:hypothetical protein